MLTRPFFPTFVVVFACLLALLLFLLDAALPQTLHWGSYLLPIVLVFLWGSHNSGRRDIYIVTTLASVLVIAGYWVERPLVRSDFLLNHLLPLAILWAVAWMLARYRQLQEQLARREQDLDQQVKVRTAALAAHEQQLAKIYNANPGAIAITRQSDARFLEANDAYLAMVGYTRQELIGHTITELGILSAESRAVVTAALLAQGSLRGRDLQLTNARGEPVDILYSSEEIDVDGEPCYLGLMVDMTAHRQMENALKDSEERFRLIVENSPDVISLFDEQGTMVYVSPAFAATHGAAAERALAVDPLLLEAINTPPGEGPHADELAGMRAHPQFASRRIAAEAVAYCLEHPGTKHRVEIASPLRSGEIRHFDAAYQAYRRAGGDLQVVSVTRDVTDQQQYELLLCDTNAALEQRVAERTDALQSALANLRRANQLKDEFMAMISHELRTPLTGVLSLSELLADEIGGPLTARQAAYVKGIIESGERLFALINGILGYTHLLAGKVQLAPEHCNLAQLLAVCATAAQHKASAKGQTITVQVDPPDLAITADPTALAEVLKRLLDNAVKFTPGGGQVGLVALTAPIGDAVEITVCDTGIGIPPDQIDHVFQAFTQADGRLSRTYEGSGLGLAYVDEMVRLMGGTIAVASTPGEGSRFTLTLPLDGPE